jgi:hypothetical protein
MGIFLFCHHIGIFLFCLQAFWLLPCQLVYKRGLQMLQKAD